MHSLSGTANVRTTQLSETGKRLCYRVYPVQKVMNSGSEVKEKKPAEASLR